MARLEIRKLKRVSRIEIAHQPITIGRSSHNNVVLRDERVSRDHCIIETADDCVTVRDLGSRTGTYVNNTRISEATLHHHDRISIGPFVLVFRDPESALAVQSAENSSDSAATISAVDDQPSNREVELRQLEAAHQLMAQQTAQIAELTASAAMLHSQLVDKTEQIASLQREVESLVQRQRNTEATRQTALGRIDRTEQKLAELATYVRSLDEVATMLAAVQEELADAERAWAEADERAGREGASEEFLDRRNQSSAALDRLNRQRDAAIGALQRAIADVRRAADHMPRQSANDHETEAKPATSSRQWWRFGARRHA